MRILWLHNIIIPEIAKGIGCPASNAGGWLSGLLHEIITDNKIELAIVAPGMTSKQVQKTKFDKFVFYGFNEKNVNKYDVWIEKQFEYIIEDFQPDIVHIFGTEYPHTLAMTKAFHNPYRTIIQMQGLVSVYTKHYTLGLSEKECGLRTFRDIIRNDSINRAKKVFQIRGKWEIEAIKNVNHVIGRTEWDKACAKQMNPQVEYHYCSEILRDEFYEGQWSYEKCNKYSIFMSQGSYPIKGLHLALEALYIVVQRFPEVCLNIAGTNLLNMGIKQTSYAKIIRKKIQCLNLEKNVCFCGNLDAKKMKEQYLKANVFVSASTIENSPNSVGEAMMLGVPIVSSNVGGVSSLLENSKEGYLYPADEPYMLAHYILKFFENMDMQKKFSIYATQKAHQIYNRRSIVNDVYSLYDEIMGN